RGGPVRPADAEGAVSFPRRTGGRDGSRRGTNPMKSLSRAPIGAAIFLSFAGAAHAGQVGSGTLSTASPSLTFTAGPFPLTNNSYQLPTGSTCSPDAVFRCDASALTVDVPADYATQHPRDRIHLAMTWPDHSEDIDLYVFD